MEPKFELRYHSTLSVLVEFYRKIGMPFWLPMMILSGAYFLYNAAASIMFWIFDALSFSEMILPVLPPAILFAVIAFLPQWAAWNVMRQTKAQNGGVEPETVVTVGNTIEISAGITRSTIDFHRIIKVRRLKYSYVLLITKRSGVLLRPDCFTKGTFEEFKQYLRQKRPDLVIPD